jgi:hypothetical protein
MYDHNINKQSGFLPRNCCLIYRHMCVLTEGGSLRRECRYSASASDLAYIRTGDQYSLANGDLKGSMR